MDAGLIFNQALFADNSASEKTAASTSRPGPSPTGGMSRKPSSSHSVVQPHFDAHWLPQLIGPSPRGTPTFWQQPFGQVMPQDAQGIFPNDKGFAGPQNASLSASSSMKPQKQLQQQQETPSSNAADPNLLAPAPYQGTKRQISTKASSTTSDLTKRKNWAHHLMHVLPDFAHVLDFDGRIVYASPSVFELAGYEPDELHGRVFADLIHPEDQLAYLSQFQEVTSQQDAPPLFLYFRLCAKDGSSQLMELTGHARFEESSSHSHAMLPSDGKRFFGNARPYPSKNASMVDSFVEHKMENERLKARLARLRAECTDAGIDASAPAQSSSSARTPQQQQQQQTDTEMSNYDMAEPHFEESFASGSATIAPQSTTLLQSPVMRQESRLPESSAPVATAASTSSHHLQQQQQQQQPSSSTAAATSTPAATASTSSSANNNNKKSRSRRPANDDHSFVCHDCGTTDSPEWRRGPLGPKTLCNACGLRWAKKTKNPKPARHSMSGPSSSTSQSFPSAPATAAAAS